MLSLQCKSFVNRGTCTPNSLIQVPLILGYLQQLLIDSVQLSIDALLVRLECDLRA